ncbi:hypothetical protein SB717_27875 [Priestia sp. SIMBA_032]|uniref:hypothetical protein n=1 Tax=Priestia sp. SIMBA_032 TaxID=3085775 RepID=UPI003978FF8D
MEIAGLITTIVTSGVVSSLITIGLQMFLKGRINYHFSKRLDSFKEQFSNQAEIRKMDIDKQLHDFTLYSTKRHEIHPELFKQIYKLNGESHRLKAIKKDSRYYNGCLF